MTTEKPNILLIIYDSLRAKNMGVHGYRRNTTPNLQEFIDNQATFYKQARSSAIWSLPSHISMFTGLLSEEHKVDSLDTSLHPESELIFNWLSDKGYTTGLFTENPYLSLSEYNISSHFDYTQPHQNLLYPEALRPQGYVGDNGPEFIKFFKDAVNSGSLIKSMLNGAYAYSKSNDWVNKLINTRRQNNAKYHAEKFLDWGEETTDPWAACINLMDTHTPYEPVEEHNVYDSDNFVKDEAYTWYGDGYDLPLWKYRVIESLYDGTIRQVDAATGYILEQLEESGELDNTYIIITSDHGEAFGEPYEIRGGAATAHRNGMNEENLHVPLISKLPHQEEPKEVEKLASTLNISSAIKNVVKTNVNTPQLTTEKALASHRYGSNKGGVFEDIPEGTYIRAAYTQENGSIPVQKYLANVEGAVSYDIYDAQTKVKRDITEETIRNRLDELFTNLVEENLRASNEIDLSDDAKDRLEELGYM